MSAHPPLEPLREMLAVLERERLPHALGASGLLLALGLLDHVNDWDVTVEADIDTIAARFPPAQFTRHGNDAGHADHKLSFAAANVELIARFAFFTPRGVVHIPTVVTRHWNGIPVGSACAWYVAYTLLAEYENSEKRRTRAALLREWLDENGADATTLRALASEPLPDALARAVAELRSA
ncbi:MAG: hypothetical protein HOP12_09255 [Candidatus Eisenbacteria bacterium]|uniref:Nucleotidyltransferase family protein n=1 Tax=Eiseniibacteriota bacterium TaxID=2212470 RepID=A0A849SG56_UNCEI|nr:hypothetical protein [Candidatus Eisenbacteria bacterium]